MLTKEFLKRSKIHCIIVGIKISTWVKHIQHLTTKDHTNLLKLLV